MTKLCGSRRVFVIDSSSVSPSLSCSTRSGSTLAHVRSRYGSALSVPSSVRSVGIRAPAGKVLPGSVTLPRRASVP